MKCLLSILFSFSTISMLAQNAIIDSLKVAVTPAKEDPNKFKTYPELSLGLSLAYDIITKGHIGELKVITEEGEGSEFTVSLPV